MNISNISNAANASLPKPCYSGIETVFECGGSYAGYCNTTTGSCECINGWSGRSDWITMDLEPYGGRVLDCPVHILALRVLYGVVFVPSGLFALFLGIVTLPQTWMLYRRKTRKQAIKWWSFGPLQVQFWIFVAIGFTAILSYLKMLDQTGSTALIGIHKPISFIAYMYFHAVTMTAHVDLLSRRNTLLKKKMFLQGESNENIRLQLKASKLRLRVMTALMLIPPACFYAILAFCPQSADDQTLPFSSGRFFLYPGAGILAAILLLIYYWTLRQDLAMIDALFRRLIGMASASRGSMTKRPSFRQKVFRKSFVDKMPNEDTKHAVGSIQEAHGKLHFHYEEIQKSILVTASGFVAAIVVPPLWTRWCWFPPLIFLMWIFTGVQVSKHHTPKAYSGAKVRAISSRLSSVRGLSMRASRPQGVPSTVAEAEEDDEV